MPTRKNTQFTGTAFFKKSQTFLGANIAKTQSLAIPEDKRTKHLMIACWILLTLLTITLLAIYTRLPKELPLFYSKAWGKDQLVRPYFLFLPIFLSLFFIFFNSFLSKRSGEYNFLKKVLILGSCVATLLAVITISRILILIIL